MSLEVDKTFKSSLSERRYRLKLNLPVSSPFEGACERHVRSSKEPKFPESSRRRLTEETFLPTMCLVEQVSNAPLLTYVSSGATDFEVLTPNNFLLNQSTLFLPVFLRLTFGFLQFCIFKPT